MVIETMRGKSSMSAKGAEPQRFESKKDADTTRLTFMPLKGKSDTTDRLKTEYGKTTEWLR